MKDLLILLGFLLTTLAKLLAPGGAKTIVADSLLMKQQLLISNRTRQRAPNLSVLDRFLLRYWSSFLSPRHIQRAAVIIQPSTLLKFHRLLKQRMYRLLYSAGCRGKPGPKGPSPELIQAIVELKRRNPRFGWPRIAQQINLRILGTDEAKAVPYTPVSHSFVERLIGTMRREFLDQTLFWNANDPDRKLVDFLQYYNSHRSHTALDGSTPAEFSDKRKIHHADLDRFRWKSHCHGLYQLPVAA